LSAPQSRQIATRVTFNHCGYVILAPQGDSWERFDLRALPFDHQAAMARALESTPPSMSRTKTLRAPSVRLSSNDEY
jgi:hypothetical protein